MNKDVIIALDFNDINEVKKFLSNFDDLGEKPFVKVGMELFYKEGQSILKYLKENGFKIFLDLKLYDIPITVKKSLEVFRDFDIDIINVHASGGKNMLKEAKEVFKGTNTKVIGVTILTSFDQNDLDEIGYGNLEASVLRLAKLCKAAQLDGVVCSCLEVEAIKKEVGQDFITVTPGIRLESDSKDDQKRIMTPAKAKSVGTDFIVVGRTITKSVDPLEVYLEVKKDFLGE